MKIGLKLIIKMEVSKLSSSLKYIESNGCTLNIEERTQLDLAFETLRNDLPSRDTTLYFWGKIRGKSLLKYLNL